jgi:hypothetical protein
VSASSGAQHLFVRVNNTDENLGRTSISLQQLVCWSFMSLIRRWRLMRILTLRSVATSGRARMLVAPGSPGARPGGWWRSSQSQRLLLQSLRLRPQRRRRRERERPVLYRWLRRQRFRHLILGWSSQRKNKKMKPSRSHRSWRTSRRGGQRAPLPRGSVSWCKRHLRMPSVRVWRCRKLLPQRRQRCLRR